MKKIFSLILSAVLFSGAIGISVYAADTPAFRVSSTEAEPGAEIRLTVSTENNPGIASFDLNIDYDSDKLEWIDVQKGSFPGMWDVAVGRSITWFDTDNNSENTVIATLTFKVKEGASGTAQVSVSYKTGNVYNINEEDISFETISGGVTISGAAVSGHKISLQKSGGGTASLSDSFAEKGKEIKVTAVPDDGSQIEKITYTAIGGSSVDITAEKRFIMPDSDVTVQVIFKEKSTSGGGGGSGNSSTAKYTLTYDTNGGSAITAEEYSAGVNVLLDKIPVKDGFSFVGWYSGKNLAEKITSVYMDSSKTVYAGWEKSSSQNPTVETTPLIVVKINDMQYWLNGQPKEMDSAPFIDENDRTMLPVRVVANALGISDNDITWNDETKTAGFSRADRKIVFCTVNSNIIKIGNEEIEIDTVPVIRNDRIYLPMRALFNAFNVSDDHIAWDGATRTVTVAKEALDDIAALIKTIPTEETPAA